MKIGLVLDDTLDSSDGVQQYVLLIGRWLASKGHEVHYLVGSSSRSDIPNIHSLAKNIKVKFNKNRLSIPYRANIPRMRQILESEQFDILHIQMPFSPILGAKILKYAPSTTAIIGTFHIAPHSKVVEIGTWALGKTQKASLKRLDSIISVSEVAQQFALKTLGLNSTVIPNSVNIAKWTSPKKIKPIYDVAFVGRLVERKGCKYLLRAINELKHEPELAGLKVVVVGDGQQRSSLENYVTDRGLSDICSFKGFVSEADKISILQSSRLAVFPATGGESFGIVLIEAMAAGALVLAGDNPGYRSVLGSVPESLFLPTNHKLLASKLLKLLKGDRLATTLHKQQQQLVKQFDIEHVGGAILKLYKQVSHDHE